MIYCRRSILQPGVVYEVLVLPMSDVEEVDSIATRERSVFESVVVYPNEVPKLNLSPQVHAPHYVGGDLIRVYPSFGGQVIYGKCRDEY